MNAQQAPTVQESAATAVPGTMTAAVVTAFGQPLEVKDLPVPEPGPGQVLVKLISTGVCHTDLHAAHGDWPVQPTPPFVPGHEGVGTVVALGPGVTEVQEGDLVGNAWLASACGHCRNCRTGWETLCEEQVNGGYSIDGSFGQYMLVDARFAAQIPAGADPYEVAPVLCAGVTVYKGLKMTEARPGEWVVISAPCLRARASLSSATSTAATRRPMATAYCTARCPRPPMPEITTHSPGRASVIFRPL